MQRGPCDRVRHDRVTARLAELDAVRTVLARAGGDLRAGWVQDDWVADGGVCLVAALRRHGTVRTGARAVDVCWHARHHDAPGAAYGVRRVPSPQVRQARVRDLTRWNDRPGRRLVDVLDLLTSADRLAAAEMDLLRHRLGTRPAVTREPVPAS